MVDIDAKIEAEMDLRLQIDRHRKSSIAKSLMAGRPRPEMSRQTVMAGMANAKRLHEFTRSAS